jgi:hypothetical protein
MSHSWLADDRRLLLGIFLNAPSVQTTAPVPSIRLRCRHFFLQADPEEFALLSGAVALEPIRSFHFEGSIRMHVSGFLGCTIVRRANSEIGKKAVPFTTIE